MFGCYRRAKQVLLQAAISKPYNYLSGGKQLDVNARLPEDCHITGDQSVSLAKTLIKFRDELPLN
jgi:hypothetical protein